MGRKVLIAALCCFALQVEGEDPKTVTSSTVKDNVSAQSVTHHKFLHYEPVRTYASGVPYNTFTIPSRLTHEPVNSGSHLVPIKEESFVIHSQNGFLKDSYGNKFIGTPQTLAYKTTLPQQFVRLQDLPRHLSQPLVAQPGFAFNGRMFGLPGHSASPATPLIQYSNAPRLQMYAAHINNFSPAKEIFEVSKPPQQQQSTNSKIVYANKYPLRNFPYEQFSNIQNNEKFQRLEENRNIPKIQAAEQVTYTTVDKNGKKTIVTLASKPPLPLIDLSLLKPLTFDNPIVPQVQHFIPPITYKLPEVEAHRQSDEYVVQKTKTYDTGILKPENEESEDTDDDTGDPPPNTAQHAKQPNNDDPRSHKPSVSVKGSDERPEISYEINSPKHKETYNEQVINYEKKTTDKPITYSYSQQTDKKPVSYSYTKSSRQPVKNVHYESHSPGPVQLTYANKDSEHKPVHKQIIYSNKDNVDDSREHIQAPKQLIYKNKEISNESNERDLNNEDHRDLPQHSSENESEESDESAENSSEYAGQHAEPLKQLYHPRPAERDEQYTPNPQTIHINHDEDSPKIIYHTTHTPGHREGHYHPVQNQNVYNNPNNIVYGKPPHSHSQQIRVPVHVLPNPDEENIQIVQEHHQNAPLNINNEHQPHHQRQHQIHNTHNHRPQQQSNDEVIYRQPAKPSPQRHHESPRHPPPQQNNFRHNEFSPQQPSRHQQYHNEPSKQQPSSHQNRLPAQPRPHQHRNEHHSPSQDFVSNPHIIEKSRKIIIQEESPDEVHSHREQMIAEMIHRGDDTKEEDFEKAYKEAAFGFPGYNRDPAQIEKDIYDPDSYGVQKTPAFNFDDAPFQQYVLDGDELPKKARLTYNDNINNMKDDYLLDYSVSQPESLLDRHKSKVNYYKMFKKQKPKYYFDEEPKKRQKSEKYTADPFVFTFDKKPKSKSKNYFAAYKEEPTYEFDYAKEAPRDSSAFPSGPIRQTKTLFVEPQFQYGFEPISNIPTLFDSELSAMASNLSPEGEKAGARKKIYQENWYIKKISTGNQPTS